MKRYTPRAKPHEWVWFVPGDRRHFSIHGLHKTAFCAREQAVKQMAQAGVLIDTQSRRFDVAPR